MSLIFIILGVLEEARFFGLKPVIEEIESNVMVNMNIVIRFVICHLSYCGYVGMTNQMMLFA